MAMEYIYPTQADYDATRGNPNEWVEGMLTDWRLWRLSGKVKDPYLCFPFVYFHPHTITVPSFWMYMYYSIKKTDIVPLKGKIKFRIHVIDWEQTDVHIPSFTGRNIYPFTLGWYTGGKTTWFKCDKAEEIRLPSRLLSLDDFSHLHGKKLSSTILNSIAPVKLNGNITVTVVQKYP